MPGMIIRDATAADAPTLVDYVIAEAREAEGRTLERATVEGSVRAALADPSLARYWIAEISGARIGAVAVTREWSDWRNAAYWYIQFVFIVPEQRGRGVLGELVGHVLDAASREGAPELRLYVHPANARAIRAYQKLGFAPLPYLMMAIRRSSAP
jgi:ribosomal protein S18 acetylase RimI-like enzyme